jgi:hypothetical protein
MVHFRKHKYNAKATVYKGKTYPSKKEANRALRLDILKNANDDHERVVSVVEQVKLPIVVNDKHICSYVLDFKVEYADGRIEYEDTKGFKTPEYKIKKKLIEAIYGITIKET